MNKIIESGLIFLISGMSLLGCNRKEDALPYQNFSKFIENNSNLDYGLNEYELGFDNKKGIEGVASLMITPQSKYQLGIDVDYENYHFTFLDVGLNGLDYFELDSEEVEILTTNKIDNNQKRLYKSLINNIPIWSE